MAEINPHPALKAAVPESPMVDGWMGDDWFHNGAFRVSSLDYAVGRSTRAMAAANSRWARATITPAGWKRARWAISPKAWALRKCRRAQVVENPAYTGSGRNRRWTSGSPPAR
jgi:predicted acyl esterase